MLFFETGPRYFVFKINVSYLFWKRLVNIWRKVVRRLSARVECDVWRDNASAAPPTLNLHFSKQLLIAKYCINNKNLNCLVKLNYNASTTKLTKEPGDYLGRTADWQQWLGVRLVCLAAENQYVGGRRTHARHDRAGPGLVCEWGVYYHHGPG